MFNTPSLSSPPDWRWIFTHQLQMPSIAFVPSELKQQRISICLPAPSPGVLPTVPRQASLFMPGGNDLRIHPSWLSRAQRCCQAPLSRVRPAVPSPASSPSLLRMRKFVPCATNHVTMFWFVVPSTDDSGAGFALTVEATPGLGWRRP